MSNSVIEMVWYPSNRTLYRVKGRRAARLEDLAVYRRGEVRVTCKRTRLDLTDRLLFRAYVKALEKKFRHDSTRLGSALLALSDVMGPSR